VNAEPNAGSGSAILLNLGPNVPERVREVQFTFKPGSNAGTIPKQMKIINILVWATIATSKSMPPHNMRDRHCQIKGQISKLELWQPIKIPTKESGPNNWVPQAKR
jgi:hypothetical protein